MDWKFANAAAPVTVLSPVSRWRCAGDVLAAVAVIGCGDRCAGDVLVALAVQSLRYRRLWRCAGDELAATAVWRV